MPPITSFVQVSNTGVLPLHIFINRKQVSKSLKQHLVFEAAVSSADTKNHRALVRLQSTSQIYLSNAQIKSLCQAMKEHLIHLLMVATVESLRLGTSAKDRDVVLMIVESHGWKVRIDTTVSFIMDVRLGKVGEAPNLLIRRPKEMVSEEIVLQEEEVITIPDEGEIVKDEKKVQKYDYKGTKVLGKGIRLEVLQIPKGTTST